ncbi:MAG: transposase [bacterium]|nr:transposase [bacterium]
MALPDRKTPRLRFGRVSSPGAGYFITLCTKDRSPVLLQPDAAKSVISELRAMRASRDFELLAATVMPDHVHLLFTLGDRLKVGQVMGKFKAKSRNQGRAPWRWQDDGFEHQLRTIESAEDYAFYIFMNPYRAGPCPLTASWPWWLCPQPSGFRFLTEWNLTQPVPQEWLGLCEKIAAKIATGD